MVEFAYTECGLSIEQFFKLSWYEWSLEIEKVNLRRKRDNDKWEQDALLARMTMAVIYNMAGKVSSKHLTGKDFIELSFDKETTVQARVMTPEEVERKFGKNLKDPIKNG